MEPPLFSRWDPLNPTNLHAAVLLGWAFVVYHRPYLPVILPSYSAFDDLMPWAVWGWAALVCAALLLLTPRFGVWRALAHSLTGLYWLCAVVAYAAGVGVTTAVTTYLLLAIHSALLFARTAARWQSGWPWWRRLVARPPRWLRWLAGVDEYAPDAPLGKGPRG